MTAQGTFATVFAQTDRGKVRPNNEDAFVVSDLAGSAPIHAMTSSVRFDVRDRGILLAVSDGMGGAQAGEVASALVLDALRRGLSTGPTAAGRLSGFTSGWRPTTSANSAVFSGPW